MKFAVLDLKCLRRITSGIWRQVAVLKMAERSREYPLYLSTICKNSLKVGTLLVLLNERYERNLWANADDSENRRIDSESK